MWYVLATWLVMSSICCSSFLSLWMRHTSSIHRRESITEPLLVSTLAFWFCVPLISRRWGLHIQLQRVLIPVLYCLWLGFVWWVLILFESLLSGCYLTFLWRSSSSPVHHFCWGHTGLHRAMLCHRPFGYPGIPHRPFVFCLLSLVVFVLGQSGGLLWHSLGYLRLGNQLFRLGVWLFHWWFFHIVFQSYLSVLFLFHSSIFLIYLYLCTVWLFHLAASWAGFPRLSVCCLCFLVGYPLLFVAFYEDFIRDFVRP